MNMRDKNRLLGLIDSGIKFCRGAAWNERYTLRNWQADIRTALNNENISDVKAVLNACDRQDAVEITRELIKFYEACFGNSVRISMKRRQLLKITGS